MRIHCKERGYPDTWVGETCPKCQVDIMREALERIAAYDCSWYKETDFCDCESCIAREALKRVGG